METVSKPDGEPSHDHCFLCGKEIVAGVDSCGTDSKNRMCHMRCLYPQNYAADGSLLAASAAGSLTLGSGESPSPKAGSCSPQGSAVPVNEKNALKGVPEGPRNLAQEWSRIQSEQDKRTKRISAFVAGLCLLGLLVAAAKGLRSESTAEIPALQRSIGASRHHLRALDDEDQRDGLLDLNLTSEIISASGDVRRMEQRIEDIRHINEAYQDQAKSLAVLSMGALVAYFLLGWPALLFLRTRERWSKLDQIIVEDWQDAEVSSWGRSGLSLTAYCVDEGTRVQHIVCTGGHSLYSLLAEVDRRGLTPILVRDSRLLARRRFIGFSLTTVTNQG